MRRVTRISRREHQEQVRATLDGLAALTGAPPPVYSKPLPEKRGPRQPTGNRIEADVNREIREHQRYRSDLRLYRNNHGEVELSNGGRVRYGVGPNGASDWIGWRTVVVTQEMVGQKVAIFVAVESKGPRGEPSDDQIKFIDAVLFAGGKAGIARGVDDVEEIIR